MMVNSSTDKKRVGEYIIIQMETNMKEIGLLTRRVDMGHITIRTQVTFTKENGLKT